MPTNHWMSFSESKKFTKPLNIQSYFDWKLYWKSHKKPKSFPLFPPRIYKKQWKGWGDFLGTGTIATKKRKFVSFSYLKQFCKTRNIKSSIQYHQYWRDHIRPANMPSNPDVTYKKQWKGWGNFLGTNFIPLYERKFVSYHSLKKFCSQHRILTQDQYRKHWRTHKRPFNIPSNPDHTFRNQWKGWRDLRRSIKPKIII